MINTVKADRRLCRHNTNTRICAGTIPEGVIYGSNSSTGRDGYEIRLC
jgi:hypothetical protein